MGCCGSGSQEPKQKNNTLPAKETKNGPGTAKSGLVLGLTLALVAGIFFGYFIKPTPSSQDPLTAIKSQDTLKQRNAWIEIGNSIKSAMATKGEYDCCLIKPCSYCIEEEECTCRQDILSGLHPCGECIGEILEGHGLPELKPYFAKAIAEKVGEQHLEHLEEIIDDMYQ